MKRNEPVREENIQQNGFICGKSNWKSLLFPRGLKSPAELLRVPLPRR